MKIPMAMMAAFAALAVSCNNTGTRTSSVKSSTDDYPSIEEIYASAIDKAEKVKEPDSTFFLGFKMGMSPKEVVTHSKELQNSGKLKKSGGSYIYIYKSVGISDADYQLMLNFDYYKEELSKLTLKFTGKNSKGAKYNPSFIYDLAKVEYLSFCEVLEGRNYQSIITRDVFGTPEKTMLKGNVQVSLDLDSYVFTDLFRMNKKREAEKESNQNKLVEDFAM